ncbi:DUF5305 domain-containing protein [Haloplanus pelagicus]|jgi:hypothetical protein|uniref:DUF5305 domain-containing protein n=1 Tax=Haloplanus pelagicus TaxID=2949995 RepID=UPI00203EAE2A|nr:DUF5305 domain-containing protein [Haloplanus sp. HW8-1]
MSREWGVRGRILLDRWFVVVVLFGVVLTAGGGYATYSAYEAPGTTTEQRQVSSWEANGTYELAAAVTESNPLYPIGTELSDRPAYFLSISPLVEGTFRFEYRATEGGALAVTIQQTLVLRAVEAQSTEGDGERVEYWRLTEPLGTASTTGVSPGQSVELAFERNVSRTYDRMANISERLGGTPGSVQMLVVSTVELEGRVNGNDVSRTADYRLPMSVSGTTYQPGAVEGETLDGSTTERVTRQRTYGPPYRIGGPIALIAGIVGIVGLAYGRYDDRFAVSDAERAALAFQSARDEFDDWITTARLPSTVRDRPRIQIDTLAGLVDTAIDFDARVFEDPEDGSLYVPHEGILYVCEPPTAGLDAMVGGDGGDDTTVRCGDDEGNDEGGTDEGDDAEST